MPNWTDVLQEISAQPARDGLHPLDIVRRKYLASLADVTGRNVIAYYSGFLTKSNIAGVEINDDDKNGVMLCVHEMDRSKGLDLLLHTPGGGVAATQSLVHCLRAMFDNNMRAIIPQIAMSAGTMIACSCKSIVMGKHSNLGPTDPQLMGFPAIAVKKQFEDAYAAIMADERATHVWSSILSQLGPSFLKECEWAIEWSSEFLEQALLANMLNGKPNAQVKAKQIVKNMTSEGNWGHDRHFHYDDCIGLGLTIEILEENQTLQDAVLTVHHCFMHTLANAPCIKIIENHSGRAWIKNHVIEPST